MTVMRKLRGSFNKCVISFSVFSLTFGLMPLPYYLSDKLRRAGFVINGLLFWAALAAGFIFLIKAAGYARTVCASNPQAKYIRAHPPGILSFFSNGTAAVFDILLPASIIAMAVVLIKSGGDILTFALIAVTVFSLIMHSLFNGRIYHLIKKLKTRREN